MRKVKNQKVIARLSDKSFRANKTRNIIAVLAIALTAMLFTTLFTIGIGTVESFQRQTMRQSGGDSHGVFKNLTREQYEKLSKHPLIKESAPCMIMANDVCNPEFLKRHLELWYYPQYHYEHCFVEIKDGTAPKEADEILMDETSMELLGMKAEAGQKVTLNMQIRPGGEIKDRTFTVSGVMEASGGMNVGFAIVSEAYTKTHTGELSYTFDQDYSMVGTIRMDVSFSNSIDIQKKLDKVITDSGYSTTKEDRDYIASNANWAYITEGAGSDPMMLGAALAGILLIAFTGYLIIYNVFQISVIRDIHYYGLLKTVGTTGKQVKRILRRQALKLAFVGIPAGLLAGFFIGRAIVPLVVARTSYAGGDAVVSLNPLIFIGAALFSLITIFISMRKPAKIAAKVSPVEATRYTDGGGKKKQKKSTDGGKIHKIALSHLGRSRGRTAIVIISLSLAVILLNSVFTITNSFDMNKYLKRFSSSDFLIANAVYFGNDGYRGISGEDAESEALSESFIEACESQKGFERGGRIYGTTTVGLDAATYQKPDNIPTLENGKIYDTQFGNKVECPVKDNGSYPADVYGLEGFPMEEIDVMEGESDLSIIKEKLASGKYILFSVMTDDNGIVVEESVMHHPGDKITLTEENGEKREFEVLSLIKDNYYGLTKRMWEKFIYYVDAEVFKEIASDKFLMSYAFDVSDDKEAEVNQWIKAYTTDTEPMMNYESREFYKKEFGSTTALITLVGGVLALVLGLIGALNFINSILTGIITRRREFALMEAVGMTGKQIGNMLTLEGLYYAGFTVFTSLAAGSIFSLTVLRIFAGGLWFMKYRFIIWPMLLMCPILLILGLVIPKIAYHLQKKESLVEKIRKNG